MEYICANYVVTLSLDKQVIMTAIFDTVGSNCSNVTTNGRTAYTSHKHWNKWAQDNITWFWTIQSWIKCQWCSKTLNRVNSAEENVNKLKKWMNIKKEEQNQTWLRKQWQHFRKYDYKMENMNYKTRKTGMKIPKNLVWRPQET